MTTLHSTAQSLPIDEKPKKFFLEECQAMKELVERAQERVNKLNLILPKDAKIIGPRAYALSKFYGTLSNLAKNSGNPKAETLVQESVSMYNFVRMNE